MTMMITIIMMMTTTTTSIHKDQAKAFSEASSITPLKGCPVNPEAVTRLAVLLNQQP